MLLPFQGVNAMAIRNPGCRFACPGASYVLLGFQPVHIVAEYNGKLAQKERPTIVKILRTSCNN